jgi:hypothetical protein
MHLLEGYQEARPMNSKNIITISFLIIALSIAYYLAIFLPEKNKQQLEREQQLRISNQQALEACLDGVDQRVFSPEFAESMKGVPGTSENVQLLMEVIKGEKEECYKKYPL